MLTTVPRAKKPALPLVLGLADTRPETYDEKAGTLDVVLAAGEKFLRDDGQLHDGPYFLYLGTQRGEVKIDRINSGRMNLLDNHGDVTGATFANSGWDIRNVLGVFRADSLRFEPVPATGENAVIATCQLSQRDELAGMRRDVKDGVLRQVSPGVKIHRVRMDGDMPTDGTPPTFRATLWEPREVSLTAVPAQSDSYLLHDQNHSQETEVEETHGKQGDSNVTDKLNAAGNKTDEGKGGEAKSGGAQAPAVAGTVATLELSDDQKQAERTGERARVIGIQQLCDKAKLKPEVAKDLVDRNVSLSAARETIMEQWVAAVGSQVPATGPTHTEVNEVELKGENEAMRDALLNRGDARLYPIVKLSDQAKSFVHYSLMDLASHLLERRGVKTRGRQKEELLQLSLHSGSDFPLLLANTANKSLRDQYDVVPKTWQQWARRGVLNDFKATSRAQMGGAPALEEVPETGAVPRGTIGEQAETIQLKPFGKAVGLSRIMMINDDLGAFLRIPSQFGVSAAVLEDDLAYQQLTANANMADAIALFHASHGNLSTGAGSALAVAGLKAARNLMRQQKGLDGKYLNLTPIWVIVPSALETEAEQLLVATQVAIVTTSVANVDVFLNRLKPIVQPRLDAVSTGAWYMLVDPTYCDTVEVGFLAGASGPRIETRVGWDIDGVEIKCMHDVCAKAIDWRGMVKSNGS
jgi:hypothetical protein